MRGTKLLTSVTMAAAAIALAVPAQADPPPTPRTTSSGSSHTMLWETAISSRVGSGSAAPIWENIRSKTGTTNVIITMTATPATHATTTG